MIAWDEAALKKVAERYTHARDAYNAFQWRNVPTDIEERLKMDVEYIRISAEYKAADRDYQKMIHDLAEKL